MLWVLPIFPGNEMVAQAREVTGMPTIGITHSGRPVAANLAAIQAFQTGVTLGYTGAALHYVPNAAPFASFGNDNPDTMYANALALANNPNVDLIVAAGGTVCADKAAQARTDSGNTSKPIVFTSYSTTTAPAANMTGVCASTASLDPNRLALLYQLVSSGKVGALVNIDQPTLPALQQKLNTAAGNAGYARPNYQTAKFASAVGDVTSAFNYWKHNGYAGVIMTANPLFHDHRDDVIPVINAAAVKVPTIYQWRDFVDNGALMSYGPNLTACYKLAGYYAGLIVGGESILNLAIATPTPELVINLTTAKQIPIAIPEVILNQATDIVI
jgi:ABC-type uncharacterized transport system substrate-binding protein